MYFDGFLRYDRKKKSSSHLSGEKKKIQSSVCWVRGSGNYDRKKKVPVVCLAGWFWRLRPENKKIPVVCLAGCAVVVLAITTGKKKVPVVCLAGCQFLVLAITTGKKKFQSSVWRVVLRPEKKSSSRRQSDYDRKKKVQVVIKFVLVQLE